MSASSTSIPRNTGPIPESLLALAPLQLPNYRKVRYVGDDVCILLRTLAERDQTLLRRLYNVLTELLTLISEQRGDDNQRWQDVARWTRRHDLDTLLDEVRELGVATYSHVISEEAAKALHDVRGGALSALLGRLQMLDRLPKNERELQTIFVLARDHHKIMRSAIIGLDDQRREADRKPKGHDVRLILEKWHESVIGPQWHERPVRLHIDCWHEGALTECCLESAAIDRIFYNLANNACRHVAGDRVEMVIFPLPDGAGKCLRFVLSNLVDQNDGAFLDSLRRSDGADSTDRGSGSSLLALFEPEVSSTGSGFGLTVVADFVSGAFGLRNRAEALRERYVGAVLDGDTFRVWFHWPVASNDLEPKLDDFHRPEQSLSEP